MGIRISTFINSKIRDLCSIYRQFEFCAVDFRITATVFGNSKQIRCLHINSEILNMQIL